MSPGAGEGEKGRAGEKKTDNFRVWLLLAIILVQCFGLIVQERTIEAWRKTAYNWQTIAEACGGNKRAAR